MRLPQVGEAFARYLKDVTTRAYVYRTDGTPEHEIALPGPGAWSAFSPEGPCAPRRS